MKLTTVLYRKLKIIYTVTVMTDSAKFVAFVMFINNFGHVPGDPGGVRHDVCSVV